MSLGQGCILYMTCSKWPPLPGWHSWIRRVSKTLPYSFWYSTNLLIDSHFEFSNGLWIVLKHIVLQEPAEIKKKKKKRICGVQIGWRQRSFRFTAPDIQLFRESIVVRLAVRGIAPFCTSRLTAWRVPSAHQKLFSTSV